MGFFTVLALVAEQQQMEVKLVVVGGATVQANEFALRLPTVVGRSRTADLPLANPLVSRKHCEIFEADGQLDDPRFGIAQRHVHRKDAHRRAVGPSCRQFADDRRHHVSGRVCRNERSRQPGGQGGPRLEPRRQIDSDDATIDVDELETLEPLAEAPGGDGEFSLSWLEEGDSAAPLTDSIGANGTPAAESAAAVKKTVAAKETAPAKSPAAEKNAAAKGKSAAPQGKAAGCRFGQLGRLGRFV